MRFPPIKTTVVDPGMMGLGMVNEGCVTDPLDCQMPLTHTKEGPGAGGGQKFAGFEGGLGVSAGLEMGAGGVSGGVMQIWSGGMMGVGDDGGESGAEQRGVKSRGGS